MHTRNQLNQPALVGSEQVRAFTATRITPDYTIHKAYQTLQSPPKSAKVHHWHTKRQSVPQHPYHLFLEHYLLTHNPYQPLLSTKGKPPLQPPQRVPLPRSLHSH